MPDKTVKVVLDGDVSKFNRAMLGAAATTKAFSNELDTSTDRAANLTQTALAIAPALVPIATAAVPALAGLSSQLAITAAAGGVALLTFNGIGEALKAVNDFQIEPTAANLEKLQKTMAELGPDGRNFVGFLQSIRPELQGLQDAGQAGMLPGFELGITELLDRGPQAERIIGKIAEAVGMLTAEAGTELAGPEWDEFFTFLETDAKPTLLDTGRAVGNLAEGFAQLWMAFAPTSANFSNSFLNMSRDFSEWASTVDDTEGFQEFLAYIDETGPEVWDTLGALANALLQIAEAAAPVGAAALPVIESVADTIAVIADSDAGPVLIGTAAGISAISRAVALYNVANGSALATLLSGTRAGGSVRQAKDLGSAYREWGNAVDYAAIRAQGGADPINRLFGALGGAGKVALGVGALAFAASDLDDSLGLSNTTTLALAGSLAGPWGAAAGAAVGITKDLAATTAGLTDAIDAANRAADGGSLEERQAAMAALREEVEKAASGEAGLGQRIADWADLARNADPATSGLAAILDRFTTSSFEAGSQLADLEQKHSQAQRAAQDQAFEEAGLELAMFNASDAAREQTEALLENAAAKNAARDAALEARATERDYEQAIDDARKAAKENGRTLDIDSEQGRKNQEALDRIATTWARVDDATKNIPSTYERARAAFISTAEGMGQTRRQAERLADKFLQLPPVVETKVRTPGAPEALRVIKLLQDGLNNLSPFKDVTIRTTRENVTKNVKVEGGTRTVNADGGLHVNGVRAFADGGLDEYGRLVARVPQMRSGSEGVVQWGEKETGWEAYISGKPGQEPRNRAVLMEAAGRLGMLDRLVTRRFAEGAFVSTPRPAAEVAAARAGSQGPRVVAADLVGGRIEIGADGLGRLIDGRIELAFAADEDFEDANRRAGR